MVTFAQELIESRRLAERALAIGESGPSTRSRSRNRDKVNDDEIEETKSGEENYEEDDDQNDPENNFNDNEIEYVKDERDKDPTHTGNEPPAMIGRLREPRESPEEEDQQSGLPIINAARDPRQVIVTPWEGVAVINVEVSIITKAEVDVEVSIANQRGGTGVEVSTMQIREL
ncbi:uncharacterized protein MELLADRAFT_111759 [Melampsora larici-populina 98AG31]|uniref:Uncharacterized protein n=1 Tax=Melampsora larici-populina (strain 98AG31 / pathotype 3-4-7) TaxID=747676 RepID=F4S448_MELLP|nr:uncharacterized protein MELLADRAFT_111759 [Melampsora larici-populina 98AG31]EGG00569.1 hypothetical protein MELLADRAFT_111759 [Melampsora larici-populina 98AG31]